MAAANPKADAVCVAAAPFIHTPEGGSFLEHISMTAEEAFLRGMLERPDDTAFRLAYADWLEEQDISRAQFLRIDPDLERIAYVPWLKRFGPLDYYLRRFPDVQREAAERQATEPLRQRRRSLGASLDPEWVALINTLACSFRPFLFFNNHGSPHECQPDELPFAEPIGTRGAIITFESDFRKGESFDPGLLRDVGFLCQLKLGECAYGAATCPVHPFICELKTKRHPLTGADILAALRPRDFRSRHIRNLEATYILYPGYNPNNGGGIDNDEIHNDFTGQHVFLAQDEDREDGADELDGTHGELKQFVAGGQMWYVLLHTTPEPVGTYHFSRYAILFAVGLSPSGERLVGVVTHQVCHNLCD